MARAYVWDGGRARYVDEHRHAVDPLALRRDLDLALARTGDLVQRLSEDYRRGRINVTEWELRMRDAVKSAHLYSMAAAAGGWENLTPEHYARVGPVLREQYRRLSRFGGQLRGRQVPTDGRFLRRARMYAESGRGTYHLFERRSHAAAGYDEERNVLGSGDSCAGCIAASERGWVKLGELVPIGSRQCLSACHCHLEFRQTGSTAVPLGAGDEPLSEEVAFAPHHADYRELEVEEARDLVEKSPEYKKWANRLLVNEPEMVGAMAEYRHNDYRIINGLLRGESAEVMASRSSVALPYWQAKATQHLTETIPLIDRTIAGAPGLPQDVVLFRGARSAELAAMVDSGELVGKVISDQAYTSASFAREVAEQFAKKAADAVVFEIETPAGTRLLPMDALFSAGVRGEARKRVQNVGDELEALFQRGTNFRVISTRRDELGRRVVRMRAL